MDLKRVRAGDWLTGAAGLAVLGSLWLSWFAAEASAGALDRVIEYGVPISAWEVFSVTDIVLALAGLGAIATLLLTLANDSPARPVAAGVVTLAVSAVAVLLVGYRIAINEPGPNGPVGIEAGGYVGALLTLGLFASCLASVRDESSPHQAPIVPTQLPAPPSQQSDLTES